MKRKIYFADLTHTAQGITAPTFPLGISFVMSYAKKELGADGFDFRLFKFPSDLDKCLRRELPDVICFSNYSWNKELAYTFTRLSKCINQNIITVFGGPNFPIVDEERLIFLKGYPEIDFYIQLEGELGFVDLIRKLENVSFDHLKLKESGVRIDNCSYLMENQVVTGTVERIKDINVIPSPYLTGILDPFFDYALVPMFETTRGCPFSCSFCSDGMGIKSKINRFDDGRIREELNYIASKVSRVDEIIITDLNFGMYPSDLDTCRIIAELQDRYHWPILVKASAGKNKHDRIIEAASILRGSFVIGAAIQSTDTEVLRAIKRSNISSKAFQKFIDYSNSLGNDSQTYSEIILGLPRDSKQKHFESLGFGINNNVNSMRMYQAMLLCGTEMATQKSRQEYGLVTRHRTIPGCVGVYNILDQECHIAEVEEIIVANNTMSFDDYVECRIMDLIVETFYNNALFEEVFAIVKTLGCSVFNCLVYLKEHSELYSPRMQSIIEDFVFQTSKDLFPSLEEARKFVLTSEVISRYIGGELGINELLVHKALLYTELDDIFSALMISVKECLKKNGQLTPAVDHYLEELRRFVLHRKKESITNPEKVINDMFWYDFKMIAEQGYKVDPNNLERLGKPLELTFFHDPEQKKHIHNQLSLFLDTPIGLGRLIQRSNLKLMYRRFELSNHQKVHKSVGSP